MAAAADPVFLPVAIVINCGGGLILWEVGSEKSTTIKDVWGTYSKLILVGW